MRDNGKLTGIYINLRYKMKIYGIARAIHTKIVSDNTIISLKIDTTITLIGFL